MTRPVATDTPVPISISAARLAIAAIVSYQILLIALIFLRPDLDPSWHTISEWAIGPYGWMMSLGFLLSAVSYGGMLVMLKPHIRGVTGSIGMIILLVSCVGALGLGVCRTDPMPLRYPLSIRGTLHVIFGTTQLMLLPFAALLINLSLALKNQRWAAAKHALLWASGLPLLGWLAFVGYTAIFVMPLGQKAYGPGVNIGWPPRAAFLTYALWLITTAWQGLRLQQQKIVGVAALTMKQSACHSEVGTTR